MSTPRLRLVGCGSLDAGDDTIGLVLADSLRGQLPPEVEVKVDTAGGINLLAWCEGIHTLMLVDAALADGNFPTGQWRRLTFPDDQPCLRQLALRGTHAFGIGAALELARRLGRLPREVVIFAVAGCQFERGAGISPAVQAALPVLQAAVKAEIIQRLHHIGLS